MALESKPLFHPEVIRQQVRAFNLPERVGDWQPKLQEWARLIASDRADDFKETALLPDFLADIFCGLLDYTGPVGPTDTHNSHLSGTGPATSRTLPGRSPDVSQPPLGVTPKLTESRQNLPVDILACLCHYCAMLDETQNQFSLTLATLSTCGRAKNQIPISNSISGKQMFYRLSQ
jgi:hypothetical protein